MTSQGDYDSFGDEYKGISRNVNDAASLLRERRGMLPDGKKMPAGYNTNLKGGGILAPSQKAPASRNKGPRRSIGGKKGHLR
jgi:hypothetical protein